MASTVGTPQRSAASTKPDDDQQVRWSMKGPGGTTPLVADRTVETRHGSTYQILAKGAGVAVVDVSCRWHAGARMREQFQTFGLTLVRRGLFVRRTRRIDQLGDSTTAYFEQPGYEQLVSHPLPAPGNTTVISFSAEAMARYTGDVSMPDRPIPVSPGVHLAHAALLSDVRAGIDEAELDARLTWLIGRLVETASPGRLTARRPTTARSHQRIVDHVRQAIAANPASRDLPRLATELGHSPFHVSRVFRQATGTTLIHHRNNVRVAAAIDQIAQGRGLADLAVELGFADQSHFARVLQRAVQLPPGRGRGHLFAPAGIGERDRTKMYKTGRSAAT